MQGDGVAALLLQPAFECARRNLMEDTNRTLCYKIYQFHWWDMRIISLYLADA